MVLRHVFMWFVSGFLGAQSVMALELVSLEEMLASSSAADPLVPKTAASPGAPQIDIVHPKLDTPIASPTAIQLVFLPSASSAVRQKPLKSCTVVCALTSRNA